VAVAGGTEGNHGNPIRGWAEPPLHVGYETARIPEPVWLWQQREKSPAFTEIKPRSSNTNSNYRTVIENCSVFLMRNCEIRFHFTKSEYAYRIQQNYGEHYGSLKIKSFTPPPLPNPSASQITTTLQYIRRATNNSHNKLQNQSIQ
jgi:hypothetical protein